MSELSTISITTLKNIGTTLTKKLTKIDLENLQNVLFHLPLRYQNHTHITPINTLHPKQNTMIKNIVTNTNVVMNQHHNLLVRLQDNSDTLNLHFFHFNQTQKKNLIVTGKQIGRAHV